MAHKNMVKALDRGENINVLEAKTNDLNLSAIKMDKKARKENKNSFCKIC